MGGLNVANKFWIDFDNGDLCKADGTAIADFKAQHCDHEPRDLLELDAVLKGEPVQLLRKALEQTVAALQSANATYSEDNFGQAIKDGLEALEATSEGATMHERVSGDNINTASPSMSAQEHMENPDACPLCRGDSTEVDVDSDDEGHCNSCHGTWKVERRFVGYSYTGKDGIHHEVTQEPADRIAELEKQLAALEMKTKALLAVNGGDPWDLIEKTSPFWGPLSDLSDYFATKGRG